MTLVELKKSLHEQIDNINDTDFLDMLNTLIVQKDDVFIVPEHMKEGIAQGRRDIANGDFITMEEIERNYEQWLKG